MEAMTQYLNAQSAGNVEQIRQNRSQLESITARRGASDATVESGSDRTAAGRLPQNDDETRLKEVATEFEAIFIKQMLKSMRSTLQKENRLVDTGLSGDIFEDMLYDEYANLMAKSSGFGLADMIIDQFRTETHNSAEIAAKYSGATS